MPETKFGTATAAAITSTKEVMAANNRQAVRKIERFNRDFLLLTYANFF
jgi:hypothetical protein